MKASTAAASTTVPVGLFGLQMKTSAVRSVMASAMASRSWAPSASSGTITGVAPATWVRMG